MKNVLNHEIAHQKYFEEMTRIPHGSYNEQAYSDYVVAFAKEQGISYKQDEMNNVILYKKGSCGYEDHAPVILQAHMDMVCEKNKETQFNFDTDALELFIEEGLLRARGTTLGADNGVGVAYILAILADKTAIHPPLECVITVQEEVGLFGAMALKKEDFQAKRYINLDDGGESASCITSSGGMNILMKKECMFIEQACSGYKIEVKGLRGGHSGGAIHKERGNANKLLGRVLFEVYTRFGLQLHSVQGGVKDNAIPREAQAMFVSEGSFAKLKDIVFNMKKIFEQELEFSDANVEVSIEEINIDRMLSIEDSEQICNLLLCLPNGLRHHSMKIEGLSTASSNLGVITIKDDVLIFNCALRGALESFVDTLAKEIDCLAETFGFVSEHFARYPAWSYSAKSQMREILQRVCQEVFHKELALVAVHGGLECGVFKAMDEDMDIVTMGPKMYDIHTPKEALDLASFDATFHFLTSYLKAL